MAGRPAAAQEATISDLGASYYRGFRTVEGQMYFMLRQERNVYDLFHLEIYGRDLQKKGTTDLRLGRNWFQGDARMVGDQAVFYFFTGKEGLLLTVDATGQKFKEVRFPALKVRYQYALNVPVGTSPLPRLDGKTTFALPFHDQNAAALALYTFNPQTGVQLRRDLVATPDCRRVPTGAPLLAMTPTEGYCIVQPFRRDTVGYTVTLLDKDLKTQWSRMYFPADLRQHVPLQVAVSKDLITLVLSDSYILNPNTPKQRGMTDLAILRLDSASGKVLFRTPIRQAGLTMLPTQLLPLADGRMVAAGIYTQPQAPRPDSVMGVFRLPTAPTGSRSSQRSRPGPP